MKKAYINYGVIAVLLAALSACSVRTFHIASDPSNAKTYYQTRRDKEFKGYTPLSFSDSTNSISPASKVILEKEGYRDTEVNIGGFAGTDVSLQVKLEPKEEMTSAGKEGVTQEKVKPAETQSQTMQALDQKIEGRNKDKPESKREETSPITEEYEALRRRLEETEAELRSLKEEKEASQNGALTTQALPEGDLPRDDPLILSSGPTKEGVSGLDKNQLNMNRALQHVFKAQQLLSAGPEKLDEALVETFKALNINNKFAFAYAVQGTIYYKKKDYISALDSWKKSIEEDPTNLDVVRAYNKLKASLGTALKN